MAAESRAAQSLSFSIEGDAASPLLRFDKVSFRYADNEDWALRDLSLSLCAGEMLAVMGDNGSGKSTFALLAKGLILPDEGTISLGAAPDGGPEGASCGQVITSLVPQDPELAIVEAIVEDDVAFGPANLGLPREELRRRVDHALQLVGLEALAKRPTSELSGGEKQRLALAGALALEPSLVIFDESSSMLDPRSRQDFIALASRLRAQGLAVILITHRSEEALAADALLVLRRGRVEALSVPQEIFADEALLKRLGLRPPLPTRLSFALRERGALAPSASPALDAPDFIRTITATLASPAPAPASQDDDSSSEASAASAGHRRSDDSRHAAEPAKTRRPSPAPEDVADPLLRCDHLSFCYEGRPKPALDDVSFQLERGCLCGLVGCSGSGKSTLLLHLNGLLRRSAGSLMVLGRDPSDPEDAGILRQSVALLLQHAEQQLFKSTVAEDIAFGPRNLRWSQARVDEAVAQAMEQVGLPRSLAAKSPFELSGGQRKRCALAGVLAMAPKLLVLDEPTAGLDPTAHEEFLSLIVELNRQGLSIILATHQMEDVAQCCDALLVLDEGSLAAAGRADELLQDTKLLDSAGLTSPESQSLAEALIADGVPLPRDAYDESKLFNELAGLYAKR